MPRTTRGSTSEEVRVDRQVADDGVLRQEREPCVRDERPGWVSPCGGVDQDVGHRQPGLEVLGIGGQVPSGRDHLDAGQPGPRIRVVAGVVSVLRRGLDGLSADTARAHDQDVDGLTPWARELRPAPLERCERGTDPVPGNAAEVLDESGAVVVADKVETDGIDPHLLEHLYACRTGREVEHRDEDRSRSKPLVLAVWRAKHDDDVLG